MEHEYDYLFMGISFMCLRHDMIDVLVAISHVVMSVPNLIHDSDISSGEVVISRGTYDETHDGMELLN